MGKLMIIKNIYRFHTPWRCHLLTRNCCQINKIKKLIRLGGNIIKNLNVSQIYNGIAYKYNNRLIDACKRLVIET